MSAILFQVCFIEKCLKKMNANFILYIYIVTEKEIFNGILNCKTQASTVLCFQRNIVDIENYLDKNRSLVGKFIDLSKDGKIDASSKSLLEELKNTKIPSKLPKSNIFNFEVDIDNPD